MYERIFRNITPSDLKKLKDLNIYFEVFEDSWGFCRSETCNHVNHDPYFEFQSIRIMIDKEKTYNFGRFEVQIAHAGNKIIARGVKYRRHFFPDQTPLLFDLGEVLKFLRAKGVPEDHEELKRLLAEVK